jgi:hypothetical protein
VGSEMCIRDSSSMAESLVLYENNIQKYVYTQIYRKVLAVKTLEKTKALKTQFWEETEKNKKLIDTFLLRDTLWHATNFTFVRKMIKNQLEWTANPIVKGIDAIDDHVTDNVDTLLNENEFDTEVFN